MSDKSSNELPSLNDEQKPIEAKILIKDKLEEKIQNAFKIFDQLKNDTINYREVGTVLRSLGVYPSVEQLNSWVLKMEQNSESGQVTWAKFYLVVKEILSGNYPAQDDEETLLAAFQTLDVEKNGFLYPDELKRLLTTMGEAFSKEEIDEMLAACTDPTENKVFYHNFCQILAR